MDKMMYWFFFLNKKCSLVCIWSLRIFFTFVILFMWEKKMIFLSLKFYLFQTWQLYYTTRHKSYNVSDDIFVLFLSCCRILMTTYPSPSWIALCLRCCIKNSDGVFLSCGMVEMLCIPFVCSNPFSQYRLRLVWIASSLIELVNYMVIHLRKGLSMFSMGKLNERISEIIEMHMLISTYSSNISSSTNFVREV